MGQADFHHGEYRTMDYTPGSAVTAGDVIVVGDVPAIAHVDIAANKQDALGIGGGVYVCVGDATIAAGKKVYWDDGNDKVTETAASNTFFGFTLEAIAADLSTGQVYHSPDATLGV